MQAGRLRMAGSVTVVLLLLVAVLLGGGTRAAALAYGVLDQMRTDEVGRDGRTHRLVDDIDVI
jgi:NTE family protein